MSILGLIIGVALLLVGFWAVNKYLPSDPPLALIGNVVLVVVLILIILAVFGVLDGLYAPVPRVR